MRVTAHVFGEQALEELVEAGIDGIEHGTGMTDATIAAMAERQVALVPTLLQLANFESYAAAGEERYPTYAKHIRHLARRQQVIFAAAYEAGVPIYAGTDAGGYLPHGLIGPEIAAARSLVPAGVRPGRRLLAGPAVARSARHPDRRRPGRSGGLRRRSPAGPGCAARPAADCAARQACRVKLRWRAGTAAAAVLGLCLVVPASAPAAAEDETVIETSFDVPTKAEADGRAVNLDTSVLTTDPGAARPTIVLAHGFGGSKSDSGGGRPHAGPRRLHGDHLHRPRVRPIRRPDPSRQPCVRGG